MSMIMVKLEVVDISVKYVIYVLTWRGILSMLTISYETPHFSISAKTDSLEGLDMLVKYILTLSRTPMPNCISLTMTMNREQKKKIELPEEINLDVPKFKKQTRIKTLD